METILKDNLGEDSLIVNKGSKESKRGEDTVEAKRAKESKEGKIVEDGSKVSPRNSFISTFHLKSAFLFLRGGKPFTSSAV